MLADLLATRSTSAIHRGELHETSLAVATSSAGVTGRFLHGERGEEDRGNYRSVYAHRIHKKLTAVGISVLLKRPEVIGTWSKDTIGAKVGGDELVEAEVRRVPTTASQTTVEPVFGTIGRVGGSSAVSAIAGSSGQRALASVTNLPVVYRDDAANEATSRR
jgi:hypothetical protein